MLLSPPFSSLSAPPPLPPALNGAVFSNRIFKKENTSKYGDNKRHKNLPRDEEVISTHAFSDNLGQAASQTSALNIPQHVCVLNEVLE